MKRLLGALAPVLFVAACAPLGGPFFGGTCPAPAIQSLVGQPAAVAVGYVYAGPKRIYHTGDPITMDFRPRRLNFEINAINRIARIRCG